MPRRMFEGLLPASNWALTPDGLIYNLPALCVLAWLWFRMPLSAAVVTVHAAARVFGYTDSFSGHAFIAGVALMGCGPDRGAGLALAGFTAYYYLGRWDEPEMFAVGLLLGLLLGAVDRGARWSIQRVRGRGLARPIGWIGSGT